MGVGESACVKEGSIDGLELAEGTVGCGEFGGAARFLAAGVVVRRVAVFAGRKNFVNGGVPVVGDVSLLLFEERGVADVVEGPPRNAGFSTLVVLASQTVKVVLVFLCKVFEVFGAVDGVREKGA